MSYLIEAIRFGTWKSWMFELGLRTTLNEITLGLHVHVFLEAFMLWLSKIVSTDNTTTNRFYILAGKQVQKQFPFLQGKGGNLSMW